MSDTAFRAYVICTTPRCGSTMLCDMLAATGEAGRPASYFRPQDIERWATLWGVDTSHGIEGTAFDLSYIAAMHAAGSAGTDIFGLRLMSSNLDDARRRLLAAGSDGETPALLEHWFGPTRYVHLSRGDKVAQAISLAKAEQSGLWHVAADGTERQRIAPARPLVYDHARIAALRDDLVADDGAWHAFFVAHRIEPLRLSYERLVDAPANLLAEMLSALGRDPNSARVVESDTTRMADAISLAWQQRFRDESV